MTDTTCKGCINLNKVYYFIGPVAVRECDCEIGIRLCDPFGEPYASEQGCMYKTWE